MIRADAIDGDHNDIPPMKTKVGREILLYVRICEDGRRNQVVMPPKRDNWIGAS
jgi:hypothetical protein